MLDEARKREKVANAFLAATMAASAAQSPKDFVRTGHIESPGTALMQMWAKKRGEAERNLDHGRVSHAARNRKKKSVEESKEHTMKEVETKLPKGHKLKNERKGKGDHVFFDVVDDKGNAIQTPVPVGGAKKGKNKYSSSLKGTATNAGNFIKKVHQAIDDVQAEKDEPSTADRMSAAVKKRISDMPAKEKYKKASSIIRGMRRKTFREFVEEAYLVEARQPTFSSREELEKHHSGIPSGYYANNAGSSENPKWRLKPKEGGVKERKVRAERIATLSSDEDKKAAATKANKLKKAGLDAHHITPLHYSAKIKSSMSDAEWESRVKRDAANGIYHGHHPKNIMGATTEKTPESRSRRGISHRAGGAHELEGKTRDIAHVGHKGLLAAAHKQKLRKEKENK